MDFTIPRPDRCEKHRVFTTRKEAEDELPKAALWAMRKLEDDSWMLLKVFECGDHFHIGRDWKSFIHQQQQDETEYRPLM